MTTTPRPPPIRKRSPRAAANAALAEKKVRRPRASNPIADASGMANPCGEEPCGGPPQPFNGLGSWLGNDGTTVDGGALKLNELSDTERTALIKADNDRYSAALGIPPAQVRTTSFSPDPAALVNVLREPEYLKPVPVFKPLKPSAREYWGSAENRQFYHPTYTERIFRPREFQPLVEAVSRKLEAIFEKTPFEAVAGTGNSSTPLLGALSYKLGIPIIATRKSGDPAHDSRPANGLVGCKAYVIVDDLIDSGATVKGIMERIETAQKKRNESWGDNDAIPKCVGIILYDSYGDNWLFRSEYFAREDIPVYVLSCGNVNVAPDSARTY